MSSELPIGYESLRAERDRLESLLQTSEDWRALVQLRARKTRGEGLSEVNSDRLELMLRDALAENPAYGRYMAVCATMDRAMGGKSRSPLSEASSATQSSGDDLTRIRGIDASMARRLRALDVLSFEQIANWRSTDILKISDVLSLGRVINSQNWIEQAAMLMPASARAPKPAEVRAAIPPPHAPPVVAHAARTLEPVAKPSIQPSINTNDVKAKVVVIGHPEKTEPAVEKNPVTQAPSLVPSLPSVAVGSAGRAENLVPPKPLLPVNYSQSATQLTSDEGKHSTVAVVPVSSTPFTPATNTSPAKPATETKPAFVASQPPANWSKLSPPRPLVVQHAAQDSLGHKHTATPPPQIAVPKAPGAPPAPAATNSVVAPPPLPNSATLVSGRPSEIKPPADAVAWALDRALEAIKNSKQTTAATSAATASATVAAAVAAAAEKITKPTQPSASKPPTPAPEVLRNVTQPPPLPPSVWQLAESAQPAAVQGAFVVPRSNGVSANGRIDRDELAQPQISVEEASVEIVRRPPASAGLPVPPTPIPVFASSEPIAELPKPESRATKPLGRFLKALTGNS